MKFYRCQLRTDEGLTVSELHGYASFDRVHLEVLDHGLPPRVLDWCPQEKPVAEKAQGIQTVPNPPNGHVAKHPHRDDFCSTQKQIMSVITDEWQTGTELAEKCGMARSGAFSVLLASLVERGWLESGNRGYRRAPE